MKLVEIFLNGERVTHILNHRPRKASNFAEASMDRTPRGTRKSITNLTALPSSASN
jgi:hypothetical protein